MAHTKQGFHRPWTHSSPLQGSPHLVLCSRVLQEEKHWPDSSPSCGWPSSAAAVLSPACYRSTPLMKESKSRDVGLSKGIYCGTLSKRIFLQAGDSSLFFQDESPTPMLPHLFLFLAKPQHPVVS